MEFTLDLPKGRRPTHEQWQQIAKQLIIDVSRKLGIHPKELSNQTYAVVHRQDQTPEYDARGRKVGTGDHMHVVIGKFTPNGECLRDLQRKTMTHVVKESFNNSTKEIGFDWTQYRDHELQVQEHANKRTVPTWRVKSAREHAEIDHRMDALSETISDMEMRANEIEKREQDLAVREAELNERIAEQKVVDKLIKNFETQGKKWLLAYESSDAKKMNRQKNRLNKTLTALDAFGLLSDDPATLEAAMIMSRVELMVDKVNYCKPQTLAIPNVSYMKLG
jgi:hypothetical protein